MHETGTDVVGHVIAFQERYAKSVPAMEGSERMRALEREQHAVRKRAQPAVGGDPRLFHDIGRQPICQDQPFADLRPIVRWSIGDLVEAVRSGANN